jgi:predicted phage gp36 major capsid-like protein
VLTYVQNLIEKNSKARDDLREALKEKERENKELEGQNSCLRNDLESARTAKDALDATKRNIESNVNELE